MTFRFVPARGLLEGDRLLHNGRIYSLGLVAQSGSTVHVNGRGLSCGTALTLPAEQRVQIVDREVIL